MGVDFGRYVNAGMPENVAHLVQWDARVQHVGGCGVPAFVHRRICQLEPLHRAVNALVEVGVHQRRTELAAVDQAVILILVHDMPLPVRRAGKRRCLEASYSLHSCIDRSRCIARGPPEGFTLDRGGEGLRQLAPGATGFR
jgi:hypothetical protein